MTNKSAANIQGPTQLNDPDNKFETDRYEVVDIWPHDSKAFTEGLEFFEGVLYESTGGNKNTRDIGLSSLRRVDLRTGKVLQKLPVDEDDFAEGLTIFRDKIFQLTYRSHKGFIYDLKGFIYEREFAYPADINEGWGLTHDDRHLIMSDGTNCIRFLDPVYFQVVKTICVNEGKTPVYGLNELEYVNGEIYANILDDNRLMRIDPEFGNVLGWVDLTKLRRRNAKVLNGIAHDKASGHLFITGKDWPKLYEIRLK
jgi:glutaminyl-peptide cyclotransferase